MSSSSCASRRPPPLGRPQMPGEARREPHAIGEERILDRRRLLPLEVLEQHVVVGREPGRPAVGQLDGREPRPIASARTSAVVRR